MHSSQLDQYCYSGIDRYKSESSIFGVPITLPNKYITTDNVTIIVSNLVSSHLFAPILMQMTVMFKDYLCKVLDAGNVTLIPIPVNLSNFPLW